MMLGDRREGKEKERKKEDRDVTRLSDFIGVGISDWYALVFTTNKVGPSVSSVVTSGHDQTCFEVDALKLMDYPKM